jgi:hypothetical protein
MRIARIALVACVAAALAVSLPAAAVGSGDGAVAAKKGCKKKGKKGAAAAKKKCKKKKKKKVVLPAPAPLVRGKLTWSGAAVDLDLHTFDAEGRHTGLGMTPGSIDASIPNTAFSGDDQNAAGGDTSGLEQFTDNVFVQGGPANREFAYLACFYSSSSATFVGIARTGQVSTLPINANAGQGVAITIPGGPAVPSSFTC